MAAIVVIRPLFYSSAITHKHEENSMKGNIAMKISELTWMMVLTASVVGSTTRIVAAQGRLPDPPGKPLTSVSHDGSLTGNGSTTSPLGIATGGVTTDKIANGAVTATKTDGTIVTAVTTSAPLISSGGSTPNISLPNGAIGSSQINSTQVQRRVTGICAGGSNVAAINQDGTVACQTGAGVTAITASAPLVSSGGSTPNISLPGVILNSSTFNAAVGSGALVNNTTGLQNTASGFQALSSNTTGGANTASGFQALFSNATGNANTASGLQALFFNTTGNNNTASGVGALSSNATGNANTASGVGALSSNTTGNVNTASGASALARNTTGGANTASGVNALFSNATGSSNTASGNNALFHNSTGNSNTAVGSLADVSVDGLTNATAIGANAVVNASNKIRLGDSNVTVIEGQVAFTFPSDVTKKENFRPVNGEDVLRKIGQFNLTSWNFIGHDPQEFRHYGPMAQDFYAAFGHDEVGTIGTPTTINSGDMAGILMIAVQALEKRTAEQREEVETLKAENATLKALLEALRK